MLTFTVGKSKVRVEVEGCSGCGTRWSWRWGYEREVAVRVGKQCKTLAVPKCGDCLAKGEQLRLESMIEGESGGTPATEA